VITRLEKVAGVSRVLSRMSHDNRAVFEVESQPNLSVRADLARAVVESGWDLNELRSAAMSLEEVFLQLTQDQSAQAAEEESAEAQP
jgi:ABC-2 type transport system ATP-binding protein